MSKKASNPKPPSVDKKPLVPPLPPSKGFPIHLSKHAECIRSKCWSTLYCLDKEDLADAINVLMREGRIKL